MEQEFIKDVIQAMLPFLNNAQNEKLQEVLLYKLDTNFVDIVVQKQRLRISINMKYTDIYDPKGLCKDITGLGR